MQSLCVLSLMIFISPIDQYLSFYTKFFLQYSTKSAWMRLHERLGLFFGQVTRHNISCIEFSTQTRVDGSGCVGWARGAKNTSEGRFVQPRAVLACPRGCCGGLWGAEPRPFCAYPCHDLFSFPLPSLHSISLDPVIPSPQTPHPPRPLRTALD